MLHRLTPNHTLNNTLTNMQPTTSNNLITDRFCRDEWSHEGKVNCFDFGGKEHAYPVVGKDKPNTRKAIAVAITAIRMGMRDNTYDQLRLGKLSVEGSNYRAEQCLRLELGDWFDGADLLYQANSKIVKDDTNAGMFFRRDNHISYLSLTTGTVGLSTDMDAKELEQWIAACDLVVESWRSLAAYSSLDDGVLSQLEHEAQVDNWESWGADEYAELWAEHFEAIGIDIANLDLDPWAVMGVAGEFDRDEMDYLTEGGTSYYTPDTSEQSIDSDRLDEWIETYNAVAGCQEAWRAERRSVGDTRDYVLREKYDRIVC